MEQIKFNDHTYYIKEETSEQLTLIRMDEDLNTPEVVTVDLAKQSHLLDLPDERLIIGKMYYKPFDWDAIENLSKSTGSKKKSIKYN